MAWVRNGHGTRFISGQNMKGSAPGASFKLIEIQEKFAIIRRDDNIIDIGAAPGSWLQVFRTLTNGTGPWD